MRVVEGRVKRETCCKKRETCCKKWETCCEGYYHYFIAVDRTEEEWKGFSLAHFTNGALSGIGGLSEVRMEHYRWNSDEFGILSCKEFEIKESKSQNKEIDRIMLRLSEVIGDRHYDPVRYNCEHVANYVMSGKLESNQANSKMARLCSIIIKNVKGIMLFVTALICAVSAASGTIVRRAYEKLLVGLFLASKHRDNHTNQYSNCNNTHGPNIIVAAESLLQSQSINHHIYKGIGGNFSATVTELIRELEYNKICDIADDLGKNALIKTSLYTGLAFILLQAIYILIRTYCSFIAVNKSFATRNLKFNFKKEICHDIFGGVGSLLLIMISGVIVQIYATSPAFAYFFVTAFSGILGRLLCLVIFEMCYHICGHSKPQTMDPYNLMDVNETLCNCCNTDDSTLCRWCCRGNRWLCIIAVILTFSLAAFIIVLIVFYLIPCCWDPI